MSNSMILEGFVYRRNLRFEILIYTDIEPLEVFMFAIILGIFE